MSFFCNIDTQAHTSLSRTNNIEENFPKIVTALSEIMYRFPRSNGNSFFIRDAMSFKERPNISTCLKTIYKIFYNFKNIQSIVYYSKITDLI